MLYQDFDTITDPAAVTAALIARAVTEYRMDADEIQRDANAASPRVWAPEACQAMNVRGSSSNAIMAAMGNDMVQLCQTAAAIAGIRAADLQTANFRGVERGINNAAMRLAR